jgi:hypothetical protein
MKGKDGISVLQVMESLDRMPVMEMEKVKPVGCITEVKLVHHRDAHAVAVFDYVFSGGLAIVIADTFDSLVGNIPPRKEMHFMPLGYQCFCEMRRSPGKPADAFSIHRFPAEKGYFK